MRSDRFRQEGTAGLVTAAREGCGGAWPELVRRYERLVIATVRSHGLWGANQEDVVQNTWVKLVENIDRIRQPERIAAWLVTTAHRESISTLRRRRREGSAVELEDVHADPAVGPEDEAVLSEIFGAVEEALADLTDRRRRLVEELFRDPQVRYRDVAVRTGLPVGSIGPTRARALAELRTRLARQGHDSTPACA